MKHIPSLQLDLYIYMDPVAPTSKNHTKRSSALGTMLLKENERGKKNALYSPEIYLCIWLCSFNLVRKANSGLMAPF